ncbi:MAG: nucleotide pyrophosphohydrolase [Desulfovermiculus sp.]
MLGENKLQAILDKLIKFRDERDWAQFQTAKNLAVSISLEAAELLEHFQWTTENQDIPPDKRDKMAEEVADILIYLLLFSNKLNIDPVQAVHDKIEKNAEKYPADLVRSILYHQDVSVCSSIVNTMIEPAPGPFKNRLCPQNLSKSRQICNKIRSKSLLLTGRQCAAAAAGSLEPRHG